MSTELRRLAEQIEGFVLSNTRHEKYAYRVTEGRIHGGAFTVLEVRPGKFYTYVEWWENGKQKTKYIGGWKGGLEGKKELENKNIRYKQVLRGLRNEVVPLLA